MVMASLLGCVSGMRAPAYRPRSSHQPTTAARKRSMIPTTRTRTSSPLLDGGAGGIVLGAGLDTGGCTWAPGGSAEAGSGAVTGVAEDGANGGAAAGDGA